jgi:HK97 family phage prohead protease
MSKPLLNTKQFINAEFKGVLDRENKLISGVVGSSGAIDRHGESLNPNGWSLNNFLRNPVILFGHDYKSLPIGKALKVWVEDGKLMFTIKFADTPMGNEVFKLFEEEMLNAFSVGFIPIKWDETGDFTFAEMELLELSVVTIPANPEALAKVKSVEEMIAKEVETQTEPPEQEKTVTITQSELVSVVKQAVSEVVAEAKSDEPSNAPIEPAEEPTEQQGEENQPEGNPEGEPVQEPQPDEEKGLSDEATTLLRGLRDGLRKSDKELGLALQKLNALVQTK